MSEQKDTFAIVLSEIVAAAGDPSITLSELQTHMTDLYNAAVLEEDQPRADLIVAVWDKVNEIQQQAGTAINLAVAAREAVRVIEEQRDIVMDEFNKLHHAVKNGDWRHPDVSELMDEIREEAAEDAYEAISDEIWEAIHTENYVSQCPACDLTSDGADLPLSHDMAWEFFNILTGVEGPIRDPLRQELADFITQFVHKYQESEKHVHD